MPNFTANFPTSAEFLNLLTSKLRSSTNHLSNNLHLGYKHFSWSSFTSGGGSTGSPSLPVLQCIVSIGLLEMAVALWSLPQSSAQHFQLPKQSSYPWATLFSLPPYFFLIPIVWPNLCVFTELLTTSLRQAERSRGRKGVNQEFTKAISR